jgi:hypothetical protein
MQYGIDDGEFFGEDRVLREISQTYVVAQDYLASVGYLGSHDDVEQGGFPGAVAGDESYLLSFIYAKGDVFEKQFFAIGFGKVFDGQVVHAFLENLCKDRKEFGVEEENHGDTESTEVHGENFE